MTEMHYDSMDMPRTSRKFHVIYIVLDVSDTMCRRTDGDLESPFERFQTLLPDLVFSLRAKAVVRTSCWLSVISFASDASLVMEASPLRDALSMPPLKSGGQTNYVKALELLHQRIEADRETIKSRTGGNLGTDIKVAEPLVFFITDGLPYVGGVEQPWNAWHSARGRITAGATNGRIAAIGLQGAREDVLVGMATGDDTRHNAFIADETLPASRLAKNVVDAIVHSVAKSTEAGVMIIETPPGMRRLGGGL